MPDEYPIEDMDLTGLTFPWLRVVSVGTTRFEQFQVITTIEVLEESHGLPDRWWARDRDAQQWGHHFTHRWWSGDSIRACLAANAK